MRLVILLDGAAVFAMRDRSDPPSLTAITRVRTDVMSKAQFVLLQRPGASTFDAVKSRFGKMRHFPKEVLDAVRETVPSFQPTEIGSYGWGGAIMSERDLVLLALMAD